MAFFCLAAFGLAEGWGPAWLTRPIEFAGESKPVVAVLGCLLLLSDVLLPVPSSVIMVGFGAVFGMGKGFLLSFSGTMAGTALAFMLGRRGEAWVARFVQAEEKARVDGWLARYGAWAMAVSRPIPILAESFAILAGASRLGWAQALTAAAAGNAVQAALYAWAGTRTQTPDLGMWVFAAVLLVSGGFWWVGKKTLA